MRASGGDDGADGTARRAALARIHALLRAPGDKERVADGQRNRNRSQTNLARTRERRYRRCVWNACADPGAGADARPRAARDRRAASIWRFRSGEDEVAGAEGESTHDDGDTDSAKFGDELVRESRRVVSRGAAGGADANRDGDLH